MQQLKSGFVFLEILISIALISIVFIALLGIGFSVVNLSGSIQKTTQIDSLIREELEAARSFRDGTTWATNGLGSSVIVPAATYHMALSSGAWTVVAGTETVDAFTRKIVFEKVSRDPATSNIESIYNTSHDDPNTKKITVTVIWKSKIYQVTSYVTNWNKQ